MTQNNSLKNSFKWHRPHFMALSYFSNYVEEVECAIGKSNYELLKRLDDALNSTECDKSILELSESQARQMSERYAHSSAQFYRFLAYLYEIEYRKSHPLDKWTRKPRLVPCPDWLPPNKRQVKARRMPYYNFFNKLSNISLIVVVCGAFPFFIAPLTHLLIFKSSIAMRSGISMALWLFALIVTTVGRCVLKSLRN